MSTRDLTEQDFQRAAEIVGCDVAALKAVREVLALKSAFTADGRPIIIFERQKFHQFTEGKFDHHSEVSSDQPGGYRQNSLAEYDRYYVALRLNQPAAMMATRWGRYQLPGWEHSHCGFETVEEFVAAVSRSESDQLAAWAKFLKACRLDAYLRNQDWVGLVKHQRGLSPDVAEKLRAAYDRYNPLPQVIELVPPPRFTQNLDGPPASLLNDPAITEAKPGAVSSPYDPAVKVTQDSLKVWLMVLFSFFSGGGSVYAGWEKGDKWFALIGGVVQAVVSVAAIYRSIVLDRKRMEIHADPNKFNVY